LLIGPGLGQGEPVTEVLKSVLLATEQPALPCVIDADALTILSGLGHQDQVWRRLSADVILTPHPGEMCRLTGLSVDGIQSDRIGVAEKAAKRWCKTVVLKGAYTVIAAPDGRVLVSPFANCALSSAGTGDVLAGVISGLLAQGVPSFEAAAAGVYVHGKAGESAARELGDAGVIATDLLSRLPLAVKELKAG